MPSNASPQINLSQADANRRNLLPSFLVWIEKLWLPVESGANRLIGAKRLNPFYHTGTITVYLFILVVISGLYLTLFYRYGTLEAYESVKRLDNQLLGQIMRGVHRYASDAAVIFIVLHTLREFFKGHFSGARWLAWVSGIILLGFTWVAGITGYWLVWDLRGQLINESITGILSFIPSMGDPYALTFLTNERAQGLPLFFVILIFLHIFIALVMVGLYWIHIIRLNRARLWPPRFQMIAVGVILVGLSLAVPISVADPADLSQLPPKVGLDYYYLSYLPTTIQSAPIVFWIINLIAFTLLTALPWIFPAKKTAPAQVTLTDCTGCTFCAKDCPYTAITMVPRSDGKSFKQEAVVNPKLCVSCSLCAGACAWDAINLGDWPNKLVWAEIAEKLKGAPDLSHYLSLVFTCQRHMNHGAQVVVDKINRERGENDDEIKIISLPCADMVPPVYISRALDMGAREVIIAGCPPYDCDAREGNVWMAQKLARKRPPYLKKKEHMERVRTLWIPPNERKWLRTGILNGLKLPEVTWIHLARGFVLLVLVLFLTTLASNIPFQAYGDNEAMLQIGLRHSTQFSQEEGLSPEDIARLPERLRDQPLQGSTRRLPLHLVIKMDDQVLLDDVYQPAGIRNDGATFVLEKIKFAPGLHTLLVQVDDGAKNEFRTVIEEPVDVKPGQVLVVGSDPIEEFVLFQ